MALEKTIFNVFPCDKSMRDKYHRAVTNLDPRGMVGRIYVRGH